MRPEGEHLNIGPDQQLRVGTGQFGIPMTIDELKRNFLLAVEPQYFGDKDDIRRHYVHIRDQFSKNFMRKVISTAVSDTESFGIVSGVTSFNGREVRTYMFDDKARESFSMLSEFLADLTVISDNLILPDGEELACLVTNVLRARHSGEPIHFYTPLCPDWSMDAQGRYDFKSLGGKESFIAKKFFKYSPELLAVFQKHEIPYKGTLIFADWGMETDLMDKNTYGTKLAQDDIRMCFDSSYAAVDQRLGELQADPETGKLFGPFEVVPMTRFFEQSGMDLEVLDARFRLFFVDDSAGKRLFTRLAADSCSVNSVRMGISREKSDEETLENLIDYAVFGHVLSGHGIIVACESRTTSIAYNLPRAVNDKVPMFFVKGKGRDMGVNIL